MSPPMFFSAILWITITAMLRCNTAQIAPAEIELPAAVEEVLPVTSSGNTSDAGNWRWPNDLAPTASMTTTTAATTETVAEAVRQAAAPATASTVAPRSTTFPSLDEDLYMEEDRLRERSPEFQAAISGTVVNVGVPPPQPVAEQEPVFRPRPFMQERNKSSWIDRIKSLFVPTGRNNVLAHAMESGSQFREKYGSSRLPAPQSLYGGGGGGGGDYPQTYSDYRPQQGGMVPDGAFAPVYKPSVKMKLTADFVELNCAVDGRIQRGIRWVKLVGLNPHGHQLFATVADGDRILYDTYHFGVRTDGKHSRLIIRNPEPHSHYGVYQCQASVAGDASIIVKEDFVVGKVV